MRRLGPACAVAAGLVFAGAGACTSSDAGSPAASGGAASGGASPRDASDSGGSPASGGNTASGGARESGGTTASGGTAESGGVPSTGGTDSGTPVKLTCVAPTRNQTVGNSCPGTSPPALKLTQVATGFRFPVYVTQAPGDAERLYVVEQQTGLIRTIKGGAIEETPFLDIKSILGPPGASSEQGFLGLAFDPYYETSRRFFIKYSGKTGQGKHVIAEYKAGADGVADPDSARVILQFDHLNANGNHNGGMLAFGPDGCLYASVGDGGNTTSPDPTATGQNPSDYFGSILRLDVDGFPTPAPGNMGAPANAHVWNYGLRNPWRFSFDAASGDMYIGDVGDGHWEEVDVEPRGVVGRNYGWRIMEGAHCRSSGGCDQTGLTVPAAEFENPSDNVEPHAMLGGYVYRGKKIPGLVGRYIYTDTFTKKMSSFVYAGETDGEPEICDAAELTGLGETVPGDIVSFGQDLAGELYVVTYVFNGPSAVYRIDPAD